MTLATEKHASIRLEASSHCNLRCPSCPTTTKAIQPAVGSGFLKLADFTALLEANPQLRHIELSNYGEIFLNPDLLEILKKADAQGLKISANNGVNLNQVKPELLEAVVRYKVQIMGCSIDGASQASYSQYRVNGNFDKVMANLREINRFKKQYRSEFPKLRWQFIAFGHNQHEIESAKAMAAALEMDFSVKLSWDEEFSPLKDPEGLRARLGVASRSEFEEKNGQDYMQAICHQLWDRPQVNWDGKILGCCRNFWGHFGSQNAFSDGLEPSLNNEAMQYAKAMLLGAAPAREDIPCTTCSIYQGMQSKQRWLKRSDRVQAEPGPLQRLRSRLHLGRFLPWRR